MTISTLGQALDQIDRIQTTQTTLADLQRQISTGKKTQLFKGLETDVLGSKRARESFQQIDEYRRNITIGDRRIQIMLNSLQETKTQAENVVNALQIQTQQGEYEMDAVSDLARKASIFVRDLINERDGSRYLFGGAETQSEPLASAGTLETYLSGQLEDWTDTTITTQELIDSYRDEANLNDTLVGYSASLTQGTAKDVFVRADDATEVDYSVFANSDALRDLYVGLTMVGQIDQVLDKVVLENADPTGTVTAPGADRSEQNDSFYTFFNDLTAMINNAIDEIDREVFLLSQSQVQIQTIDQSHQLEQNILQGTIDDIENIDDDEVAVKLNTLLTQLEASYRVTATISQLSLVNFI